MIFARTPLRVLTLLLLALSAFAVSAGDFSGTYALGAAAAAGKDVQLTIMLSVANNTYNKAQGNPVEQFIQF